MKLSRVRRNRIRKIKSIILGASAIIALALALVFIVKLDDNREWTYEECVGTYYGSHPDYIAKQCNYLRQGGEN